MAILLFIPNTQISYQSKTTPKQEIKIDDIKQKISNYADEYGVDRNLAHYMAYEESRYKPDAVGDMDIKCPETGEPFRSRGLYQLSQCYYGHYTDAQAFDPDENIKIAMSIISEGKSRCISQFSSCKRYYE